MKNSIFVLFLATTLTGAYACSSDDNGKDGPTPSSQVTVTVSQETLNPDFSAQTLELTVNASSDWSIRTEEPWITFKPSGGVKNQPTTVFVTVEANKEFDSRSGVINIVSGNTVRKSISITQGFAPSVSLSLSSLVFSGNSGSQSFTVTSNTDWKAVSSADWVTLSPSYGGKGESTIEVTCGTNDGKDRRDAVVSINYDGGSKDVKVSQLNYNIDAPEGYTLVWNDEFDYEGKPNSDWVIENQSAGWVNNELQTYTSREIDGKLTLEVKDGFLHVNCFKAKDGKVYSGRMNARPNTGWTYGYVEARINLPSGKGTWPAFWMMPSNVDWSTNGWPKCGEIDIMEEVGVDANRVSSSLHTEKYNHTKNTQKTHEMLLPGAEGEFHTYALEWTEDTITTYVDGKVQLRATKAEMGSDHDSWPFHYAFYPIINLAWGGDWGGYAGVNEAALPVTMLVDYVRIFQKK